jgi:hypothetical protein
MATALDVAEALATVIPAKKISGRGALDDVIRKQLNEQSVARQTAITNNKPPGTETAMRQGDVSTGLFRKLDMDGVSRLEEVEIEDTRVAAPRARRNSEQGAAMPGDTSEHEKFLRHPTDPDRHTEVGGPPTGAVPKDLLAASNNSLPKQKTLTGKTDVGTSGGKGMMIAIILAVLLAVGGGIWALTREKGNNTDNVVTPAPSDGGVDAPKELFGQLTIDPVVEGATGYLESADGGSSRQVIPAITHAKPYRVKVTANSKLHLHLEVPGYSPYDDTNITVPPNETLLLRPSFATAPARLAVTTEPAGVSVTLAGRPLGETPKTFEGLTPGNNLVLELSKAGYQPITRKVTLEAGKLFEVKETLKEATKFGTMTVQMKGMWAEVHHNGRNLGRNSTPMGPRTFSLPVGKQKIVLINPQAGKQKTIFVNIKPNEPAHVSESFE